MMALCLLASSTVLAIDASVAHASFRSDDQPYVEVYLHIAGKTIIFAPASDSTLTAAVDVLILLQRDGEIVGYDKYRLHSPVTDRRVDLLDIKRFALPAGTYQLSVTVTDAASATNTRQYEREVVLRPATPALQLSDLQLLADLSTQTSETDRFAKAGLHLEPLPSYYYGRQAKRLAYYLEVYGAQTALNSPFIVTTQIEEVGGTEPRVLHLRHQRQEAQPVNAVVGQADISNLPSGNYRLTVSLRSLQNEELLRQSLDFQRNNPLAASPDYLAARQQGNTFVDQLNADTLEYSLYALTPLLPQGDVQTVGYMIKEKNVDAQRMYLYNFWREEEPAYPEAAYRAFMQAARAIDKEFRSGFRYGFETDRGYVYLKYGQPTDITRVETEPSAPPYELWSYNHIERTGQNNVRFIFYNPNLAAEDFVLLHSDVIGERQNPQWQMDLYRNAPNEFPQDYLQGTDVQDNMGRWSRRFLRDY